MIQVIKELEQAKARLAGELVKRLPEAKVEVGPRRDYYAQRLPDSLPHQGRTEVRVTIGDFHIRDEVDNFDLQQDGYVPYYVDRFLQYKMLRDAYARLG